MSKNFLGGKPMSVNDCAQLLYQVAADGEFRAELEKNPDFFGQDGTNVVLPDSVERLDQTSLKLWSEGLAAMKCVSTCTFGPITIVCDGTTY
jgi:Family of unknown function (DUF5973)